MIKRNTGENLLRYHYKNYKFECHDVESENLNLLTKNKPWELGYILVENGQVVESHNRRIWWDDLDISEDAARITRFNYQDYKNTAEDAEVVLNDFEKLLFDPQIINITYNGLNFDMYLHNLWRKKLGKKVDWSFIPRSIDVLALSRAYRLGLEPPEKFEDFLCWQFKLINYYSDDRTRREKKKLMNGGTGLAAMAKELGVSVDEGKTHQGLYDVELTWEIFKQLMWKLNLTTEHLNVK